MDIKPIKWEFVTGNAKLGDIILYFKNNNGQLDWTHSAVVTEVDTDGFAIKAKSKMGEYEIIEHHPRDVTDFFGVASESFMINNKSYPSRLYIRKK
ncbi:hypothetical protein [Pedobacter sp.]